MPGLTAPAATTAPMGEQHTPARFTYGGQVTILITATVDSEWDACVPGGGTHLMLGVRLPDGRLLTVPADYPGIRVIHGDISPALAQVFADAMRLRDCPEDECTFLWQQHDALREALGLEPALAAVPD